MNHFIQMDIQDLKKESEKQARDTAELKTRLSRLSTDIEELKKWASTLQKIKPSPYDR